MVLDISMKIICILYIYIYIYYFFTVGFKVLFALLFLRLFKMLHLLILQCPLGVEILLLVKNNKTEALLL